MIKRSPFQLWFDAASFGMQTIVVAFIYLYGVINYILSSGFVMSKLYGYITQADILNDSLTSPLFYMSTASVFILYFLVVKKLVINLYFNCDSLFYENGCNTPFSIKKYIVELFGIFVKKEPGLCLALMFFLISFSCIVLANVIQTKYSIDNKSKIMTESESANKAFVITKSNSIYEVDSVLNDYVLSKGECYSSNDNCKSSNGGNKWIPIRDVKYIAYDYDLSCLSHEQCEDEHVELHEVNFVTNIENIHLSGSGFFEEYLKCYDSAVANKDGTMYLKIFFQTDEYDLITGFDVFYKNGDAVLQSIDFIDEGLGVKNDGPYYVAEFTSRREFDEREQCEKECSGALCETSCANKKVIDNFILEVNGSFHEDSRYGFYISGHASEDKANLKNMILSHDRMDYVKDFLKNESIDFIASLPLNEIYPDKISYTQASQQQVVIVIGCKK